MRIQHALDAWQQPEHAAGNCAQGCHNHGFSISGTAYRSGHEPDNCNAGASGATIDILQNDRVVATLPVNSAGNFFSYDNITGPYRARVNYQGRSREMLTPQTNGACNSCHTQGGASGAPGRVALP